jgi:hypothetical protein
MLRRFGQFLALIAVMASALNAQCALSCSMQALPQTTPNHANIVQSAGTGHAGHECCPSETIPKPTRDDKGRSCSDPLLTTNSADVTNVTNVVAPLHCFGLALIPRSEPVVSSLRSTLLQSLVDSPASRDIRAFFILRI